MCRSDSVLARHKMPGKSKGSINWPAACTLPVTDLKSPYHLFELARTAFLQDRPGARLSSTDHQKAPPPVQFRRDERIQRPSRRWPEATPHRGSALQDHRSGTQRPAGQAPYRARRCTADRKGKARLPTGAGCLRPSLPRSWREGTSPQPALAEAESESEDVACEHRALFGEEADRPRFGGETESGGS